MYSDLVGPGRCTLPPCNRGLPIAAENGCVHGKGHGQPSSARLMMMLLMMKMRIMMLMMMKIMKLMLLLMIVTSRGKLLSLLFDVVVLLLITTGTPHSHIRACSPSAITHGMLALMHSG